MTSSTASTRRRARELLFRLAYQADLMGEGYGEAWARVRAEERLSDDQRELVSDLVAALEARGVEVDDVLRTASQHWDLERLAATDRAVMRGAVAELLCRPGTPARVVLDEAIEIAKRFGTEDSGRFVNGVLDRAARNLRPGEL